MVLEILNNTNVVMKLSSRFSINGWISGLLFPIISFVYALFHPKSKNYDLYFVLFFVFVVLAFYYASETADIVTYIAEFKEAHSYKKIGLVQYINSRPDKQQIDYYSNFMLWFISRFTGEPRVFLVSMALVFAIFFAANASYLIKHIRTNSMFILLLITFVVAPKVALLTHRWWTALQVFMYGLLPVVIEKKYWRLLWCFVAAFVVHFSFLYPLIFLLISLLLPKKSLWVYLVLYIFTVFANSFDFSIFSPFFRSYLPTLIADRTENYINAEIQVHNFFSQTARIAMNIANVVLLTVIYIKGRADLQNNSVLQRFYTVALLIGSFAALASITEWGWRYLDLSNMVFLAFYIIYLSNKKRYNNVLNSFKWVSPLFIYFIAFQIRGFLCIIGPYQLLFGNYFTTWFIHDTTSVMDLIK